MSKVYLIGDLHGDFRPVRDLYNRNKEMFDKEENTLICLGDFGANFFFNHRDEEFKKKLGKYPFTYFIIRGNHEERPSICMKQSPEAWHIETYFGNVVYVENAYPYIKYALDTVAFYNINEYKTLVIPGAYSVDKYRRLAFNWSWFPQEQLSREEMTAGKQIIVAEGCSCDLVLSHTCPLMYEPTDLFLSFVDQSMVEKDMEHYLQEIELNLDYKAWCWGHYHAYRDYPRPDGCARTMLFNDCAIELDNYMTSEQPIKF